MSTTNLEFTQIQSTILIMTWRNICVFGDSIAWGAHRLPARLSWANLLRNDLENKQLEYRLYDLGVDMNTTKDVIHRFVAEATARNAEIIVLDVGVNDSLYRKSPDNPETAIDVFDKNMQALITMAQTITSKVMIVGLVKGNDKLTMPLPQSTTGKIYTKERVRIYDRKLKELAERYQIPFADVYDRLSDDDFNDGLHPNERGYAKMYEVIRKEFEKLII